MPAAQTAQIADAGAGATARHPRTLVEAQIAGDGSVRCTCGAKVGDLVDSGVEFVCRNTRAHGANVTVLLDVRERRLRLAEIMAANDRDVIALFREFVAQRPGAADIMALVTTTN